MRTLLLGSLSLSVLGLPSLVASPRPGGQAPPNVTAHVDVLLPGASQKPGSLSNPAVQAVADTLSKVLLDTPPKRVVEAVRATLEANYGPPLESSTLGYKRVWCEEIEEFKYICCEVSSFDVVALGETVRVVAAEGTEL